jgi:hypothetical protein
MISIESSWGYVTTDDQGNVLQLDLDDSSDDCYLYHISKFDIARWDMEYESKYNEPSPKPSDFDILMLGYWDREGQYTDPTWRD